MLSNAYFPKLHLKDLQWALGPAGSVPGGLVAPAFEAEPSGTGNAKASKKKAKAKKSKRKRK